MQEIDQMDMLGFLKVRAWKAKLYAQTLGDDMRPTIERVMESISQFIERLQGMDQSQRLGIIRFAALTAAAGPVILIFGRLATGIGKVSGWLGTFCTAVGKAGGGVSGLLTVLAKSPAVWLAVGAAAVYGVAKLYDWASGAKMAREATQALIDKAKEWKDTAAETFYGKSGAGLSFFGMSEDAFKNDNTAKSARAWLTGLTDVWSDGKAETDEIVTEWVDTWKSLTDNTRTELQALQASAKESGYTGVSEQIQADIDSLDSMDREISALLKKRQNGYLTDDEKLHLQEPIDQREAIIIKYKLQPDSETEGFQTILDKVEAEVARAQACGQQDAEVSVYQNAMVAAAQGMATLNSEIDAQYDSEYALIQLMEDGADKEAALAQLNTSYNEQRLAAAREYAQTLAQLVNPVWNDEGMQQTGDTLADLASKLTAYDAAVKTYGANSYEAAAALDAVKEAATGLDEGSLTEYAGVLTQISELLTSGMSMDEVQALFPGIDVSTALEQLASIQQFTSQYSSSLEGLASMFGEGLSEEVLKIATELDMTGAQANWDEFAANPGAITTDAIIAGIQEQENAARQQVKVDAVVDKLITTNAETGETSLTVEGIIGYVTQYAEATTGADVSGLTPDNVTAMVTAYQELASGADVSTLKPDEIVAYTKSERAWLQKILPAEGNGRILVTTHTQREYDGTGRIKVDPLDENSAVNLLSCKLREWDKDNVQALAKRLHCFSLALALAGGIISTTPGYTAQKCMNDLERHGLVCLDDGLEETEYHQSILAIIRTLYDKIKEDRQHDQCSCVVEPLLLCCALGAPYDINIWNFHKMLHFQHSTWTNGKAKYADSSSGNDENVKLEDLPC